MLSGSKTGNLNIFLSYDLVINAIGIAFTSFAIKVCSFVTIFLNFQSFLGILSRLLSTLVCTSSSLKVCDVGKFHLDILCITSIYQMFHFDHWDYYFCPPTTIQTSFPFFRCSLLLLSVYWIEFCCCIFKVFLFVAFLFYSYFPGFVSFSSKLFV